MQIPDACRLRIYIDDSDSYKGLPIYEWLVDEAYRQGMAGATVFRGTLGYGGNHKIHSSRIFALAADLPIVVELIDSRRKIDQFLALVEPALGKGLATREVIEATTFAATS